jgi:hypothetical protein
MIESLEAIPRCPRKIHLGGLHAFSVLWRPRSANDINSRPATALPRLTSSATHQSVDLTDGKLCDQRLDPAPVLLADRLLGFGGDHHVG